MPYPNEHAARIRSPQGYERVRRQNDKFGPGIHAIFGVKPDGKTELQAVRFDKSKFTAAQAKAWLAKHKYKDFSFEPAKKNSEGAEARPGCRLLQEYADSRGLSLAVDRGASMIPGVKILGLESTNGRTYPKQVVAEAVAKYDGAQVNLDHATDPGGQRSYRDRIGVIRNPRLESGERGLYADFYFNPKHLLAEQLVWDAEHAPENVGFSHVVEAKTVPRTDPLKIEEIIRVVSVDLVANPATSRGLFESDDWDDSQWESVEDEPVTEGETMNWQELTEDEVRHSRPDLVQVIAEKAVAEHVGSEQVKAKEAETQAKILELTEQNKQLAADLDQYKASEAVARKKAAIEKELAEAKVPDELVTEVFRRQLLEAKDEAERKALITDRLELVKGHAQKPKSRDQASVDETPIKNAQQFAEAVRE